MAARDDLLYHAFVYLRHILLGQGRPETRLDPALQAIYADPHRRSLRTEQRVPAELARSISPAGLARIVSGALPLQRSGRTDIPLVRLLGGYLPEQVDEIRLTNNLDTPENRFVKAFLDQAAGVIDAMAQVVKEQNGGSQWRLWTTRTSLDCETMARIIAHELRHGLWHDVGRLTHLPVGSSVLQRKRGYRAVLAHFARLRMATRLPLSPDSMRDLLEMKDIALLYELWCFFRVVDGVRLALGAPLEAETFTVKANRLEMVVRHDMAVRWSNGTAVYYNPRFSRSRLADRHSYSVPLRPDIAVDIADGPAAGLHLLDAKFRLDKFAATVTNEVEAEEEAKAAEERGGTFKRADLYKMHTYRDAIPCARSVWVLYPGDVPMFFQAPDREFGAASGSDGVGVIPMRPEEGGSSNLYSMLASWMRRT